MTRVEHTYTPSVGENSVGAVTHQDDWSHFISVPTSADLQKCSEEYFKHPSDYGYACEANRYVGRTFYETHAWATYLRYILSTGSNWKNGIEKLRVVIDGAPVIFLNLSGEKFFDFNKLEIEKKDFKPKGEILVEFLQERDPTTYSAGEKVQALNIETLHLSKAIDGPANCRAAPDADAKVTKSIPDRDPVRLVSRKDDWYEVRSQTDKCWTHKKNLR